MDPIALGALVLSAGLLFWWMARRRPGSGRKRASTPRTQRVDALDTVAAWPPEATKVLTPQERKAHLMLAQALPDFTVLAQLPLSRFIRVPTRNSYQEWMHRCGQLCADLVICDHASQVIAVVDVRRAPGQDSERTQKRHQRMDRVLRQAGIRVVVWNEEALPHQQAVREQVLGAPEGMSSDEGSAKVRTQIVPARTVAAPAAPLAMAREMAILSEVIELPSPSGDRDTQAEPTPSTWFDNLDSQPMALDPLRR